MALMNQIFRILQKLLCGGNQQGHQQQQHQQYPQQQGYNNQQQGYNNQQQSYPPQQQPSWSQVAGGNNQNHGQQQQHGKPPGGGAAADYYQNQTQPQQPHQQQGGHGQWNYQPQHGQYPSNHLPAGGVVGPHHPGHQVSSRHGATFQPAVTGREGLMIELRPDQRYQ
jgi:hypothetical protein